MELEFRLREEDYNEFVNHACQRVWSLSGARLKYLTANCSLYVFLGVALGALYHLWRLNREENLVPVVICLALLALWGLAFHVYKAAERSIVVKSSLASDGAFLQPQKLTVSDDGVSISRPHSHSEYRWPSIRGVGETLNLIYLYIDNSAAIIVPKRAFPSDSACRTFFAQATDKQRHANEALERSRGAAS